MKAFHNGDVESLLLDALSERVLIYDGAMGTQLQAADIRAEDWIHEGKTLDGCNELLNFTRPDLIQSIHEAYFDAGSDMVETNSFGNTSIVLAEYGIEHLVYELNLAAAQIARRAADAKSTANKPRFVVGALGPGTKLSRRGLSALR